MQWINPRDSLKSSTLRVCSQRRSINLVSGSKATEQRLVGCGRVRRQPTSETPARATRAIAGPAYLRRTQGAGKNFPNSRTMQRGPSDSRIRKMEVQGLRSCAMPVPRGGLLWQPSLVFLRFPVPETLRNGRVLGTLRPADALRILKCHFKILKVKFISRVIGLQLKRAVGNQDR